MSDSIKVYYKDHRVFEVFPLFSINYLGDVMVISCQGIMGNKETKVMDTKDIEKIEIIRGE